jgi:hypothetical protein
MKARTLTRTGIKVLFTLLFSLFIVTSYAQYENTSGQKKEGDVKKRPAPQKPNRWFAGGMIGAGFSSYSSYVELAPLVGFRVTPAFLVGTRITYIWNSYEYRPGQRANLHHYGVAFFGQYIIFKGLFAHVEYEALSFDYVELDRQWINSLFLGGGYMQNIGGRGFASFAILFNVLDSPDSPYVNPIFRIGFGVGF